MTKHFRSRSSAEADLFAHGFRPYRPGIWAKEGCIATMHPQQGCMAVVVGYVAT